MGDEYFMYPGEPMTPEQERAYRRGLIGLVVVICILFGILVSCIPQHPARAEGLLHAAQECHTPAEVATYLQKNNPGLQTERLTGEAAQAFVARAWNLKEGSEDVSDVVVAIIPSQPNHVEFGVFLAGCFFAADSLDK